MKLLTFIFLIILYIPQSALASGADSDKPYQYPDVWVRDGGRVEGMVISWVKHGKPIPFDAKDVLLNTCGMDKMCGQFFFSGKKIKGKWEYAEERSVIKITLDDGGIMYVKRLGAFSEEFAPKPRTSDDYFKDGRHIRHRGRPNPSNLNFNSTASCNFWNKGNSGYFEMLSPTGERIWAKHILVQKNDTKVSKGDTYHFFVYSANNVQITPDNQVILASAGMTVRLNPQTGEMDKPHPQVRIIDADEVADLFDQVMLSDTMEKSPVPPKAGEQAIQTKWRITDDRCAEKINRVLYQKYFEGK